MAARDPARPLRLAHRGDWRRAPENSIEAFRAALRIPACDGLEFDVRLSADGIPVVCHDASLARVQGRPESIDDLPASTLGRLGVPTLADVLAAAGRRAFLDIELKVDGGPRFVDVVAAGRGPDLGHAVVSSFHADALQGVARRAPHWPRWLNTVTLGPTQVEAAVTLGCRGVAVDWRAIDESSIGRARAAGLEVAAWTVRRRPTFERLARLGVVAVCAEAAALDG